ncbi:MAG TPA: protein kinase [Syntrophomonadaceae bacterium]|nr:protein kinase [Syntrophomonadaceae bacterium]
MNSFLLANRYEIEAEIGRGGTGIVYRARDRLLNRTVAVKMLHPHLARNEIFREHLWQEAQAAAALSHPNIISIYDLVKEGEQYFLVMEYFPGEDLRALLRRVSPLPFDRAAYLIYQVCLALAAAHSVGVIHQDIKPRNILVNAADQVKVADFGLAVNLHDASLLEKPEQLIGSLPYLAPERIRCEDVCIQTDIYSAGVVLYELLTGRIPFTGASPKEVMDKHLYSEPVPVNEINPTIPPALDAVVRRALAKDPARRFPSAVSFARALKAFFKAEDEEKTRLLTSSPARKPLQLKMLFRQAAGRRPLVFTGAVLSCLILFLILPYTPVGVTVPRLQGLALQDASRMLDETNLRARAWRKVYSEIMGEGRVAKQWPPAGSRLIRGLPVFLTISMGSRYIPVPDVRGRPVRDAVDELLKAGFRVAGNDRQGVVVTTDPPPNTRYRRGALVELSIKKVAEPERKTLITVRLSQRSDVRLEVQDSAGRRTVYDRRMDAGEYKIPVSTYGHGVVFLYIDQVLVRSIPVS